MKRYESDTQSYNLTRHHVLRSSGRSSGPSAVRGAAPDEGHESVHAFLSLSSAQLLFTRWAARNHSALALSRNAATRRIETRF